LVVIDGADRAEPARAQLTGRDVDVIELPVAVGKDRFNGHRIYGAAAFIAQGELITFLDEDNWPEPDHVASMVDVIFSGRSWAYSLRRIVLPDGLFLCNDECESLGMWPSLQGGDDHLIDVSCFLLPVTLAVAAAPIWYRRARDPGIMEVDRALTTFLRKTAPDFDCSYRYSLNYRTGSTGLAVRPEYFIHGNAAVYKRYGGCCLGGAILLLAEQRVDRQRRPTRGRFGGRGLRRGSTDRAGRRRC
jgi:hypothetical protein